MELRYGKKRKKKKESVRRPRVNLRKHGARLNLSVLGKSSRFIVFKYGQEFSVMETEEC